MRRGHRGRCRIGLFGAFGVAEECQDEGTELVGVLDLRHVTDTGEQMSVGVREQPASGVEMTGGHDAAQPGRQLRRRARHRDVIVLAHRANHLLVRLGVHRFLADEAADVLRQPNHGGPVASWELLNDWGSPTACAPAGAPAPGPGPLRTDPAAIAGRPQMPGPAKSLCLSIAVTVRIRAVDAFGRIEYCASR